MPYDPVHPDASVKTARILAIDFWRGVALLMIFVDHVPANPLTPFMPRSWGYSDAAEIFVFLAGFSAMLSFGRAFAEGRTAAGILRVAARVWQLYRAHLLLSVGVAATVAAYGKFGDASGYAAAFNVEPLFASPQKAIPLALTLRYMPGMSDILPIYIIFIAAFPLVWALIRISPFAALVPSAALWIAVNVNGANLPNYPDDRTWFLNPLAWQFIFVLGAAAAKHRERLANLARSNILLALAIAVAVLGFVNAAPWTSFELLKDYRLIPLDFSLIDEHKTNLFPLRVLHFAALLVLAMRALPGHSAFWNRRAARGLMIAGRHALPVYCAGTVLSLATFMILESHAIGSWKAVAANAVGVGALVALALMLEKSAKIIGK